jgi:hypothetical protein
MKLPPCDHDECGPVRCQRDVRPSLGAAFCSALYDVYHANNDYDCTGATVSEAYADANFELATGIAATLFLRHDLTREQALKEVDNLRWLVEQRFPQNVEGRHAENE